MSESNGRRRRRRSWLSRLLGDVSKGLSTLDPGFQNRMLTEAYSRIMHALFLLPGEDAKVVLVASAVEGEGASTVARQLAAALAESRSGRVLLIDADDKRRKWGDAPRAPAAGLLSAGIDAGDPFVQTSDGFSVLPYDHDLTGSYSLHRSRVLAQSLRKLGQRFDWMVIDGRPVTQHTETAALSTHADATVLVLRAESTRSQVADRALEILRGSGAHVVGAVLNRRRYHIPNILYRRL